MKQASDNVNALPQRHKPASGVFISRDGPTIVFLTVCALDRTPWLAQDAAHETIAHV